MFELTKTGSGSENDRDAEERRPGFGVARLTRRTAALALLVVFACSAPARALNSGDVTIAGITPFAAVDSNNCAGNAGPHAMYLQATVTNNTAGTLSNLTATLNGFAASPLSPPSPPTSFTLDLGESAGRDIGVLAAGQTANLFWFVDYPCTLPPTAGSSITYTITVSDGTPSTVTSANQTLTTRSELSASAGGDVVSSVIGAGAVVGQILKVTINYSFGNPASGSDLMIQPAGNVSFDASRFRLVAADITASTFTAGPLTSSDNRLYFASVTGPSQNTMTVDYYFLALATAASSTVTPFADLKSGGPLKYTGNFGTCTNTPCDQTLPPPNDPFAITKVASPTSLASGGTVTYTVTVSNTSAFDASFDAITDVLPAGATYQGFGAGSDITAANSSAVPSLGAGGTIVWRARAGTPPPASNRNYFVAANSSLKLVYTAAIPNTPGAYDNSATASAGSLTIGPATSRVFVGPTPTNTAVPTATNTAVPTATNTAVPTATNTAIPTATNTAVPTATNTAVPTATNTAVPTATNTAIPTATDTAVPTATDTAVPTATNTALPTATDTAVPTATNTAIPTATDTAVPTATDTAVPTPTNTALPTATDTAVPTATETAVPTATDTPVPTATDTAVPTATDTALPTATDTAVPTATDTPVPPATDTPAPTATETAAPTATDTAVATATNTAAPTATDTAVPTPTDTPVPTATETPVPASTDTPVPTATDTAVATATNTPLLTATDTAVPTATNTPLPTATATDTSAPTATATPQATSTLVPSPTATSTPAATATQTALATSTPADPNCGNGALDPGEECDQGALNSDTTPNACRTNCRLPGCGDGVADTPVADFIFVIETSLSMTGDLKRIPSALGTFPEAAAAAGVDYRLSLVRFGTGRIHNGPDAPVVTLPFTTDGDSFRAALGDLRAHLTGPTESGSEALDLALDSLPLRPRAIPVFIVFTDEDDDLPVSIERGRRREPPGGKWLTSSRRPQFQTRLDEVASRLVDAHGRLVLVINPHNRPAEFQYGAPRMTALDGLSHLDLGATRTALAAAGLQESLQGQLLSAGRCTAGRCAEGALGYTCASDADCGLYSRAYEIKAARRKKTRDSFYASLMDELLELARCQP